VYGDGGVFYSRGRYIYVERNTDSFPRKSFNSGNSYSRASGGIVLDKGILNQRRLSGGIAAVFIVLCMIAAALLPLVSDHARAVEYPDPYMAVTGENAGDRAGRSIALLDIDGDGNADLIVGVPNDPDNGKDAGKVMIFLGSDSKTDPDVAILGSGGERFGFSVARAGDLNHDGKDDLIVGAPFNDEGEYNAGAAYLFFGRDASDLALLTESSDADKEILGEDFNGNLGYAVSTAEDVNSDGDDDVLVGVPGIGTGKVHIFYGGESMDTDPDKTFYGANDGDRFGSAVAAAGSDISLDGTAMADILVGAPMTSSGYGAAWVILNVEKSSPRHIALTGNAEGDRFGTSVAILDFNDDGIGDVAVGAPYANSKGEVSLYYGGSEANKFDRNVDKVISAGQDGDEFGRAIAAGDPKTDHIGDLVVGAPRDDTGGSDAGRVYVFYGDSAPGDVPDVIVNGTKPYGYFGCSVASGSHSTADYDGDGAADFAIGETGLQPTAIGAAYLYTGYEVILPANPQIYGFVLDVNGDAPLDDALVTIDCQTQTWTETVRTLANGSYGCAVIIEVPPGTYTITASYDGYFDGVEENLELNEEDRVNVTLRLDKFPEISGTIYDGLTSPSPDPLEDALVEVRSATGTLLDSHTTDVTGTYSFVLESTGEMTITASKQDYFDNSTVKTIEGGAKETIDMVLQHKPEIDVHVHDAYLSGSGENLEGVTVTVEIDGTVVATGTTDADGSVTLIVDGQGYAYVNVSKIGYEPESWKGDLVENTTTALPTFEMNRRPSVSGTVTDFDGFPVSGACVELLVEDTTDVVEDDTTDAYGWYAMDAVSPDTYDIRVTADGYYRDISPGNVVDANQYVIVDFTLYEDPISPTSEATDPSPGDILDTSTFDITVNATDPNDNGISQIDLYFSYSDGDFELWEELMIEEMVLPYVNTTFTLDTTEAYGDGVYAFYTIAWDLARNEEAAPLGNDTWIIMNSGKPFSYVEEITPYEQAETTFTVTAIGDDPFGVQYVELWYYFDGPEYDLYAQDDTSPYSWEFDATDGDGVYDFYSILVNGLDQSEDPPSEPDASALVDTTSPVITVDPPIDPITTTSSVDLCVVFSDAGCGLSAASYQVDSDDPVELDVDEGSEDVELDVTLNLEDGAHTILLSATDVLDWISTEEISFVVDTTAPSVVIEEPVDGVPINTKTVEVQWTIVEDPASGIVVATIQLDEEDPVDVLGLSSYSFEGLDDVEHTISIYVESGAGLSDTDTTTFWVDTIDPVVVIKEVNLNADVYVRWEESDIGSGLDWTEVRLDDGDPVFPMTNFTTFSDVAEGDHTINVTAFDKAGNEGSDEYTFYFDQTPPEIVISSPEDGKVYDTDSVEASWVVTDGGDGVDVDTVEYRLDAGTWTDAGSAVGTVTLSDLSEGTHTFSIRASDLGGNVAEEVTVSFTVDTLDPTVTITYPEEGGDPLDTEDVLVEYTVDGTGTSATVERRVDGGAWESAGMASTLVESLAEGLHTVDIRATDEAGNDATASVEFTVDLGAPTVTITYPEEDGETIPTDTITIEWTVSDPTATVEVKLDGGAWEPATGDSATFSDLSDGEHTVIVNATDPSSSEGEDSVTFTVDTIPPTVSIESPEDDAVFGSSSVEVSWTSTDAVTTERSVDGGAWQTVVGTSVTISSLVDGEHTISIRVVDVAGHEATDSVTVLVDTTDPTVEITAPSEGATVGTEVTVEWTADDGLGSGIDTGEVSIDGGAWTAAIGSSYTFTGLTSGGHTVDVKVTDDAGNEGTDSVAFTVTAVIVDTTAPTVSITSPTNGSSLGASSVTVAWTASDGTGSGIDTIEVKLDAGAWTTVTGSSHEFTALAEGTHMVSVRVTDNAGNAATATVTFMVDTVDPSLSITSPEDAWETEDKSVTVTWTCTDVGCGIDRIEVCIDGGAFTPVGTVSERIFSDLEAGEHTVDVRAYDKAGNMVETSVDFTVTEGGGISALLIGGIVLAIIVLAAVAVMLMRRKKASAPPPPMQE
jgi:hypothetical protein